LAKTLVLKKWLVKGLLQVSRHAAAAQWGKDKSYCIATTPVNMESPVTQH
jgi:hypothetical protein